VTKTFPE